MNTRSPGPGQLCRLAAVLAVAVWAAGLPSEAGQASAAFQITIEVLPEGSSACTASASTGAPQVTCRPTVVGPATPATVVGGPGERNAGSALLGYRRPDTPVKLAGEMTEVGTENHFAWTENNYFALGEYSSRLMTAGGVEYVEMTVTW